jgi:hypothetical protein
MFSVGALYVSSPLPHLPSPTTVAKYTHKSSLLVPRSYP